MQSKRSRRNKVAKDGCGEREGRRMSEEEEREREDQVKRRRKEGMRNQIQGQTEKIRGHLRGSMET